MPLTVLPGGNTNALFSDFSRAERFCPSNTWGFRWSHLLDWTREAYEARMDAPWQERSEVLTPQGIREYLLYWIQQELGLEMYWGTWEWVNSEPRFKGRTQHKCAHLFKLKLPITLLFPCIWFFPGRWQEIAGRLWFFLQWKATINHIFFWPCSYRETEWIWAIFSDSTGCSDSVFGAASSLPASML